ncbi:M56 family metallopeptidase [Flavobacterium sp.]|uniref:M56 family metallopeptidase n=1 Tax=Flavobacterium sp. TaxID=239 RepID=UPI0035B44191
MEQFFIYLIKSSGLLAMFYLAYQFLIQKETFFNTNRWFLLSGLLASLLLPLVTIKKIVYIEVPKATVDKFMVYSQPNNSVSKELPTVEAFHWIDYVWVVYIAIAMILVVKIIISIISLYKMLLKQQIVVKENIKFIDLNKNIAPFSFFKYIVFNSNLYNKEELNSILLHEEIHCKEKHTIDLLIARMFCVIFWFNPFMWLYKKAIIQNLEYIADSKAMLQIEDKKEYQRALLKVVTHQNSLSITNQFYQSLIKKRIVMLNKNQSHKRNSLKYALVLPALIAFIVFFQIQTIAQEKETKNSTSIIEIHEGGEITFDATESDKSLSTLKNAFKEEKITTEISKIKRNSIGEITGICIKMKCEDGRKKELKINQSTPIDKILIYTNRLKNGSYDFGIKQISMSKIAQTSDYSYPNSSENDNEEAYSYSYSDDFPSPPVAPVAPVAPVVNIDYAPFPNMPTPPSPPVGTTINNEKEWKIFEKKLEEYEKKVEALEPEMEAYAKKMSKIDEQMKPFEKEMELYEQKMKKFEEEMQRYVEKLEAHVAEKRVKAKAEKK